jgi:hypothetical protein
MHGIGPTAAKYGLVAAGAFVLVVVTGLFVVSRNDERRLAQLEAELKGSQLSPSQVSPSLVSPSQVSNSPGAPSTTGAQAVAAPPVLPNSEGVSSARGELALGDTSLANPPETKALATDASLASSPAEAAALPSAQPSGAQPGAASPPADGWLHASQLPLQDEGAPATPSWFASLESSESGETAGPVCSADRSLRTALVWAKSPQQAAEQARREGKLVFLIHVSGNFEDPGFT